MNDGALPLTAPAPDLTGLPEAPRVSEGELQTHAETLAAQWEVLPKADVESGLEAYLKQLESRLKERLRVCAAAGKGTELTPQLELLESGRAMEAVIRQARSASENLLRIPHVRVLQAEGMLPRIVALAQGYLERAEGIWSGDTLAAYARSAQRLDPLQLKEVQLLPLALQIAQLEYILTRAHEAFAAGPLPPIEQSPFSGVLHSLRRLNQFQWRTLLENLVPYTEILRQDPAGVFAAMDEETRNTYRLRVAELACDSDASEVETARAALELAEDAAARPENDARRALRQRHIGYYLVDAGVAKLTARIGHHPPLIDRMRTYLRANNEDLYILSILMLSFVLMVALIAPLVPHHDIWPVMGALLLALLPATQGAVDLVNNAVLAILEPSALPKLDYKNGIPGEATTLVVVPTLLLNEAQVRDMFDELEARYLSNRDPQLHFGLLTDLPDSASRPRPDDNDPLVQLAVQITNELNAKYQHRQGGSFFLLHRHRVFNTRQGVWMGWERKRGKLLDLNKLLLGTYDSFPIKAGPMEALRDARYVITLDSDTQLPRGTAARMVGTMMHPLNRAIVDAKKRVVTAGYGLLQPRVGVSVSSASRSRFAALYSGETGFDIYTRAVSDVYQDLFGEGIFAGKGIYEVSTMHLVLEGRFPRNSLLSHDLIEGAYVRAGLATDIEVIDDYPSHYLAHTRRKHRWVRGDWQIAQWLFGMVPDESGRKVPTPISNISRWKIFDNLRRSLVEPVTFAVLVLGWLVLPGGAMYWTAVTLVLLLLPVLVQLGFNLGRAIFNASAAGISGAFDALWASLGFTLINLAFLPHQTLLSLDAIVRSIVRGYTGKRLLEWETAAQAETGKKKTSLDLYLQLTPLLAIVLALVLGWLHPSALAPAGQILLLWALSPVLTVWLNSPPVREQRPLTDGDKLFLETEALSIWKYFERFGDESNHWLIPDNVEEKDLFQVRKLSPTNLGMLFNTRQAAVELGFMTPADFARSTLGTLETYARLEKCRGHIFNWYDIETLQPLQPKIVSAVDSGNLAASLYTLHGGAMAMLRCPLITVSAVTTLRRTAGSKPGARVVDESLTENDAELLWLESTGEGDGRVMAMRRFVAEYAPWLLAENRALTLMFTADGATSGARGRRGANPLLEDAADFAGAMEQWLGTREASLGDEAQRARAAALRPRLAEACAQIGRLTADLARIAHTAESYADAMEYGFLLVEARELLSIGFDGDTGELYSACYDLLASEARIASFLAVAKGDIPQESWFKLDRSHVLVKGRAALLSWTGTMFEYLMPTLWMKTFPETLLTRALESVIAIQRGHVKGIPWGISESGFAKMDPQGRYGYQAWGVPALALKYGAEDGPVISPYSTFLTLPYAGKEALDNLLWMAKLGWTGEFGFYEAADYTQGKQPEMVRSWMAHHQGMSLLAITNLLRGNAFQRWFHAHPMVRAAELLLHERGLAPGTVKALEEHTSRTPVKPPVEVAPAA